VFPLSFRTSLINHGGQVNPKQGNATARQAVYLRCAPTEEKLNNVNSCWVLENIGLLLAEGAKLNPTKWKKMPHEW
jgi:hypothetical protein